MFADCAVQVDGEQWIESDATGKSNLAKGPTVTVKVIGTRSGLFGAPGEEMMIVPE